MKNAIIATLLLLGGLSSAAPMTAQQKKHAAAALDNMQAALRNIYAALESINSAESARAALPILNTNIAKYKEADYHWDIIEDQISDAEEDKLEAQYPEIDILEDRIERKAEQLKRQPNKCFGVTELYPIIAELAD